MKIKWIYFGVYFIIISIAYGKISNYEYRLKKKKIYWQYQWWLTISVMVSVHFELTGHIKWFDTSILRL